MIQILDEITLAPERVPEVLALLRQHYLPGHASRGLSLAGQWVSPPVAIPGQSNLLWLLWQVADAPAYYRMRAMTDAAVVGFWANVDAICESRRRHVMVDAQTPLPAPLEAHHAA
ncbi:hypothetical protein ACFSHT_04535 [Paraburkholderia silviterrae]|uniref:NIPSNAP protein n=1 Tax=Paraburkholderia silviterrae TaxID=2528715 RepID=A0A4R5M353_9BURK|nr:hypothetical protein [Paraburkholderia silviterrae]TDG20065.1 hypothetical protein EYW47_28355 [Paraburkholderia silviterrae]